MRKVFDIKSGAVFHQETPNVTLCVRKDYLELVYKVRPGVFVIINALRGTGGDVLLHSNWGSYFNRLQNPDAQLPVIRKKCPTLYAVLVGTDPDEISEISFPRTAVSGLGLVYKTGKNCPLLACLDDGMLKAGSLLADRIIVIYNESMKNPPFPAWKDGLTELWG